MSSTLGLAQGCLFGAFVGDAAGARLEFLGRKPTEIEIADALEMRGGGVFQVAPGQVTDDGELTLALARALVDAPQFPRDLVAANYRAWFSSRPFDMGNATSAALAGPVGAGEALADAVSKRAAAHNMESKANGALMRSSGLAIWSTRLSTEGAGNAARDDARLTHPNQSCQWANAAYVVAIRHLLLNPEDRIGAFAQAKLTLTSAPVEEAEEVLSWLGDAESGQLPAGYPNAGFVRIAFSHAFHHMLRGTSFVDALHAVLACGGDTDTNACIVGALVGARAGLAGIPENMTRAVLCCDTSTGQPRPGWLRTHDALELAGKLLV